MLIVAYYQILRNFNYFSFFFFSLIEIILLFFQSIDSSENASKKARNQANKIKFQPILETLSEGTEGIDKDSLVDKDCDN